MYQPDPTMAETVRAWAVDKIRESLLIPEKQARDSKLKEIRQAAVEKFAKESPEENKNVLNVISTVIKEEVRRMILVDGIRTDGRTLAEVRPISAQVGLLPRVHGSGLFSRGQTQVLTSLTLGAVSDEQVLDGLEVEESKRFMHHYNFPPSCVGETRLSADLEGVKSAMVRWQSGP